MRGRRISLLVVSAILLFLLWTPIGGVCAQTPEKESAPEGTAESGTPADEASAPTATGLLDEVLTTRTPVLTATPGPLEQGISRLAATTGLDETRFLGLTGTDWLNLGVSLIFVLAGYLLGTWLIRRVLLRLIRRTPTEFDDRVLKAAGNNLRWLVVILLLNYSTTRLTFVSATVKMVLSDIYFVLGLIVVVLLLWRLIDLTDDWYQERLAETERGEGLEPVIVLLVRVGRILIGVIGLTILLSHFGINVTAFVAALGIGGLALSLGARDTIADAIAGFIILVDRPFRIGDRIEIQGVGTWGDVADIGLRTTRIRTRDNRMVIVPNSVIGSNQVINYTYPDPQYRIETHVGIAYGTDIETARRTIIDTVQQLEGVLQDKPVDALYIDMGDSAMIFRVRWWIESYVDTRRMLDRVHTAVQHALDEAGIESPYPTQTVNLRVGPEAEGMVG
jgi:MscS family membrane protein